MRLIMRFALVAAFLGLALGLLLRRALGRGRFTLLALLALVPLALHAAYVGWILAQGGVQAGALALFGGGVAALLVVAGLLARRWTVTSPLLAAFLPGMAAIGYAIVASIAVSVSLAEGSVVPNAVAGASYGLASIAGVMMLLVFVPQPASPGGKLRLPWRRP